MVIIITPKGRAFHSPFGKKITRITSLFHEVSKSKQIATVLEKWGWNVTASPPAPPPGKLVIERGFIHPSRVCSVYYVLGIVLDTGGASTSTTDKMHTQYSTFDVNTAKNNQQSKTEQGLGHLVTVFIVVLHGARALLTLASGVPTEEGKLPSLGPPSTLTLRNKEASATHLVSLPPKVSQKTAAPALSSAFGLHERMTKLECVCPPLKDPERLV